MALNPDLQALHLRALAEGRASLAICTGDAEAMLWEAPRHRVVRRRLRLGDALISELHALLDADGRPLAWWQRSAAAAWIGLTRRLPVAHQTIHEIATPACRGVADRVLREQCIDAFIAELAQVAGTDFQTYRRAWWPERRPPAAADAFPAAALL